MDAGRVLTLNNSYMPLALIDWMRAICLLFQGKAEMVVESDRTVSSPSTTMAIPAIIRLNRNVYPSKRRVRLSRANVLLRDGNTCQYCGKVFPKSELNLDHVVPRAKGGQTKWTNIVTCCIKHNTEKGDRTPEEAGMRLLRQPEAPGWSLGQEIVQKIHNIPEAWEPYLGMYMKRGRNS